MERIGMDGEGGGGRVRTCAKIALAVVVAVGIAGGVAGCGTTDLDPAEVDLSLLTAAEGGFVGDMVVRISGRSFTLRSDGAGAHRKVEVPGGTHTIDVWLVEDGGEAPLASVSFEETFSDGYEQWVTGRMGIGRPGDFCFGTLEAAPLSVGSPPDTLFVAHGWIPEGAQC